MATTQPPAHPGGMRRRKLINNILLLALLTFIGLLVLVPLLLSLIHI